MRYWEAFTAAMEINCLSFGARVVPEWGGMVEEVRKELGTLPCFVTYVVFYLRTGGQDAQKRGLRESVRRDD